MYDQGSMDRIGRLMSLRDLVTAGQMAPDAAPLPMNTLRNNTTGAEYQFESSPQGGAGRQSPQLDYSQPIEIFGQGKGYAIKGQPLSAMINGRRVDYGVDSDKSQAMTQAAQDRALKLEQVQQGLDAGALDIAKEAHGKLQQCNRLEEQSRLPSRKARRQGSECEQTTRTQSFEILAAAAMCSLGLSNGLQKLCRSLATLSER
jgi:hypothetical protein